MFIVLLNVCNNFVFETVNVQFANAYHVLYDTI